MILVTGGTGLIGSHLLVHLAKDSQNTIYALKRHNSNINNTKKVFSYYSEDFLNLFNKIKWVEADISDRIELDEAMKGMEKVYHCAGLVSFNTCDKKKLFETNEIGTENIVNACLENNIKKLIYVSSIATLGDSIAEEIIDEDVNWLPEQKNSVYSKSKYCSELQIWRGVAEGLDTIIVNPSVVIGPGFFNKDFGGVIKRVNKGFSFYSAGSTGFVDVNDLVHCMILLMESEICNERFIISAENLSFREIVEKTAEKLLVKLPVRLASFSFLKTIRILDAVFSFFSGKKPRFTRDGIKILMKKNLYSNKKILNIPGVEFTPIDQTLKFVVEKFREEKS